MDRDELRDKINRILFHTLSNEERADKIMELIAPELEKAKRWDGVEEMAARNELDGYPCEGCPVEDVCDSSFSLCGQADSIVDALTEKEAT